MSIPGHVMLGCIEKVVAKVGKVIDESMLRGGRLTATVRDAVVGGAIPAGYAPTRVPPKTKEIATEVTVANPLCVPRLRLDAMSPPPKATPVAKVGEQVPIRAPPSVLHGPRVGFEPPPDVVSA